MAAFGVLVGWRFLGPRMRGTWQAAAGLGLSSSVFLVLLGLLAFSGYEMLRRAMRMAYGGNPFEALEDMFQIAVDFLPLLGAFDVVAVLIVGGILVGWVTEAVARRWS